MCVVIASHFRPAWYPDSVRPCLVLVCYFKFGNQWMDTGRECSCAVRCHTYSLDVCLVASKTLWDSKEDMITFLKAHIYWKLDSCTFVPIILLTFGKVKYCVKFICFGSRICLSEKSPLIRVMSLIKYSILWSVLPAIAVLIPQCISLRFLLISYPL